MAESTEISMPVNKEVNKEIQYNNVNGFNFYKGFTDIENNNLVIAQYNGCLILLTPIKMFILAKMENIFLRVSINSTHIMVIIKTQDDEHILKIQIIAIADIIKYANVNEGPGIDVSKLIKFHDLDIPEPYKQYNLDKPDNPDEKLSVCILKFMNNFVIVFNNTVLYYDVANDKLHDMSYKPEHEIEPYVVSNSKENLIMKFIYEPKYSSNGYICNITDNMDSDMIANYKCKRINGMGFDITGIDINSEWNKIVTMFQGKPYIANIDELVNSRESADPKDSPDMSIWRLIPVPYEDPEKEFVISILLNTWVVYIMTYKNIYVAGIVGATYEEKMRSLEVAEWSITKIIPCKSASTSKFKINKIVDIQPHTEVNTEVKTKLYDGNLPILWNTFFQSNSNKTIMAITYDSRIFNIYYDETINDMVANELITGNIQVIKEYDLITQYDNLIIDNTYMIEYENKEEKMKELLDIQLKLLTMQAKAAVEINESIAEPDDL